MPFDRLTQDHLPSSEHAAPTSVRSQDSLAAQRPLQLISVGEPCDRLEGSSKPIIQRLQLRAAIVVLPKRTQLQLTPPCVVCVLLVQQYCPLNVLLRLLRPID